MGEFSSGRTAQFGKSDSSGEALPVEGREGAIGPEQADVLGMPAVWSSQTLPLGF